MIETQDLDFWEELEMQDFKRKNRKIRTPEHIEEEKRYFEYLMEVPIPNTIITGEYIGIFTDQHCFNVNGFKDWVRVDNRPSENKYLKNTSPGDTIEILLNKVRNDNNFIIQGTICGIYETAAHQSLKSLDEDAVVVGNIKSSGPAGYEVDIIQNGITLSGFMPNTLAGINKLHDPESIVGEQLELMIESFSKDEGTYIVSRRKYLNSLVPEEMKKLDTEKVYNGVVTGTAQFGVFIEFNKCLTGMIHRANIHPDWQDRITEINPGTIIEFYVKEIVKGRIILTQILRDTLWDSIKSGQILEGIVMDKKQFGVLVSLDEETMGLIHTSELEKLNRKFTTDEKLKVRVLAVDRQNRKIFLTVA